MRRITLFAFLGVAIFYIGLTGCKISLSGSASLNANGTGVVLEGPDAVEVKAKQPELPPVPPPPPPPPPPKAKIVGKKIEITEKVMFDVDKATIKTESDGLLNDIAAVLKNHLSIKKISIEGHTDGDGSARYNKKLSDKRAKAVRDFLVKLGIDEARMDAKGFGEDKPLASNDTDEGKEKNRRVGLNIVTRDPAEAQAEAEAAAQAAEAAAAAPEAAPPAAAPEAAPAAAPEAAKPEEEKPKDSE